MKESLRVPVLVILAISAGVCDRNIPSIGPVEERLTTTAVLSRSHAVGIDARFKDLAQQIPGFGGYYIDGDARLNVYLVDPQNRATAQRVLSNLLGDERFSLKGKTLDLSRIVFLQGDYDFLQLLRWRNDMRGPAFTNEFGITGLDVDERTNRVGIGIQGEAVRAQLEAEIARRGIPRKAVIISVEPPAAPLTGMMGLFSDTTLRDKFRPVPGGVQIVGRSPDLSKPATCTFGFNARTANNLGRVFVTNSHCTQDDSIGGNNNANFHQPTPVSSAGNYIGTEIEDRNRWAFVPPRARLLRPLAGTAMPRSYVTIPPRFSGNSDL